MMDKNLEKEEKELNSHFMGPSSFYGKHKTASARKISIYSSQNNLQFFNKRKIFPNPKYFPMHTNFHPNTNTKDCKYNLANDENC